MRTANDLPEGIRELVIDGRLAWRDRDYERARTLFQEALLAADRVNDRFAQMSALHFLGNVAFNQCQAFIRASLEAGGVEATSSRGGRRMKLHANHRTCPSSRRLICQRVRDCVSKPLIRSRE